MGARGYGASAFDEASAETPKRPARHRRQSFKVAVLIGLTILLASMLTDRFLPMLSVKFDKPTRYTLPPNLDVRERHLEYDYTLRTNSRGLRCAEVPMEKPPGVRRIVLLGDAQTAGVGVEVEQTFGAILEQKLPNTTLINCGRPWANTLTQARILFHVGLEYGPDLVLLCVSADDLADMPSQDIGDIYDAFPRSRGLTERFWPNLHGARAAWVQRSRYAGEREPFDWRARMEGIARRKKIAESEIERWRKTVDAFPELVDAASRNRFNGNVMAFGLFWRHSWADALDIGPGHGEGAWKQMQAVLGAIALEAVRSGFALAVVFLPARVQYDRDYQNFLRGFGHNMTDRWLTETSHFQIALGRWCGDRGIPFLDLTAAFRGHPVPGALSTRYGGMLTVEGHALVADQIAPWLCGGVAVESERSERNQSGSFGTTAK